MNITVPAPNIKKGNPFINKLGLNLDSILPFLDTNITKEDFGSLNMFKNKIEQSEQKIKETEKNIDDIDNKLKNMKEEGVYIANKRRKSEYDLKRLRSLSKMIEKGETSLRDQTTLFIKQSGKNLAIAVASIFTFLITGQIIPESLFITTFVLIPIIIMSSIIYFIIDTTNKSKNELRSDLISLASSHKQLRDNLVHELMSME